jgi:hypothetical protein
MLSEVYAIMASSRAYEDCAERHNIRSAQNLAVVEDETAELVCAHLVLRIAGKTIVEIDGRIGMLSLATATKTMLVGVRAFVHEDPEKADEDRKADWTLINRLRNDVMHGLEDEGDLSDRPMRALAAAMHYLHHAICLCSHTPDLNADEYKLARGGAQFVMVGRYTARGWPRLQDWKQVVETKSPMFRWVPHPEYGLVPELEFRNEGVQDLEVGVGRLEMPLSVATMHNIVRVDIEHDA